MNEHLATMSMKNRTQLGCRRPSEADDQDDSEKAGERDTETDIERQRGRQICRESEIEVGEIERQRMRARWGLRGIPTATQQKLWQWKM